MPPSSRKDVSARHMPRSIVNGVTAFGLLFMGRE